jgi:hypothetical protein
MHIRDIQSPTLILISSLMALSPALEARQTTAQSVQYKSPAGVEYRSQPDTDAVKTARAALEANPKDIAKIIDLGVAQSGARQFREAIATFTRGLEIEPNNALLLRWRGHRYLSVREFDKALPISHAAAGLTRRSTASGITSESFSSCVESSPMRPRRSPKRSRSHLTPASSPVPPIGCGCRSAAPAAAPTRRRCSIAGRTTSRWTTPTRGA